MVGVGVWVERSSVVCVCVRESLFGGVLRHQTVLEGFLCGWNPLQWLVQRRDRPTKSVCKKFDRERFFRGWEKGRTVRGYYQRPSGFQGGLSSLPWGLKCRRHGGLGPAESFFVVCNGHSCSFSISSASLVKWLRRQPRRRKVRSLNPAYDGIFPGRVVQVT